MSEIDDDDMKAAVDKLVVDPDTPSTKAVLGLRVDVSYQEPPSLSPPTTSDDSTPSPLHHSTNIFIAGIPSSWNEQKLRERFACYGEILSVKLVVDRHFAFVMFRSYAEAKSAIVGAHLQRADLNSPKGGFLHVSMAMHDEGGEDVPNPRVFIRGLSQDCTKKQLLAAFNKFGVIVDTHFLTTPENWCKGVAFISYQTTEEAAAAVSGCFKPIRIGDRDVSLIVKFSETASVRKQRCERNKARQSSGRGTPQSAGSYSGLSNFGSPNPGSFVIPHMQAMPPFYPGVPFVIPPQSSALVPCAMPAAAVAHPPPMPAQLPLGLTLVNPYALGDPSPVPAQLPFPCSGDVFLSSPTGPISEQAMWMVLSSFGTPGQVLIVNGGMVVRMSDRSCHEALVQQLGRGVILPAGQVIYSSLLG
jgi:hypothetical protein